MPPFDILIQGATVYDGLSADPKNVSVGLRGERIAYVGEPPTGDVAATVVEGRGLVLCPGFVDSHASTGFGYLVSHAADNKLFQGVTSEVIGNCGTSNAPIGPQLREETAAACAEMGCPFDWQSVGEWFARLEGYGLPINVATHVGHSTLRAGIAGEQKEADSEARRRMGEVLDTALDDGAIGMTTGLVYAPGSFASTAEIVDLARRVGQRGGVYASHIRNEREGLEDAVAEAIEIGRAAEVPVLISHLKAAERPNWGKLPRMIETIEAARAKGQRVTFEVYPYTAVSTKLRTFIPKDMLDGGVPAMVQRLANDDGRQRSAAWLDSRCTDFEAMTLITESLPGSRGKSVAELARQRSRSGGDTVVDLLLADPEAWIVYDCLAPADLEAAILWSDSIVASDSWSYPWNVPRQIGDPHPRTFGAFARFLERYALREERLPLGEAVRKITSLPADFLGLTGRGRIAVGAWADLVLLDPERFRETATFAEPRGFAEGAVHVWVNGTAMLAEGKILERRPGHVLRRRGGSAS
jgi:N-acyl-D-amino-acid deacylase